MALTFTKKLSTSVGDKKFKIYEITHDGSATTIDASSLELYYIDYAIISGKFALSGVTDFEYLSGTANGTYVEMANALTATTIAIVQAWGY